MKARREVILDARKVELLRNFPWEENYPRLIASAEWLIQDKIWNSGLLPKGCTAESIVRDAIAKTFSGQRNWEPDKGDLLMWLKWVIRSEISHLAESAANRAELRLEEIGAAERSRHRASQSQLQVGSPEEAVIHEEVEEERYALARSKVDALLDACSGRPELERIVYAISDGKCTPKPQDLSEYLGRPVDEIYQNLRALRRRASKIRIEAENGRE